MPATAAGRTSLHGNLPSYARRSGDGVTARWTAARYTRRSMSLPPLSLLETRILGVLVEKQLTVPDTYPLTLNALVSGLQPEDEPRPRDRGERGRGAVGDRPPQGAVARRRVERRPRDALRAERRARARDSGASGRAPHRHHAARAADRRRAAHPQRAAASLLATSRPSKGFLHELAARAARRAGRGAAAAAGRARDALGASAVRRARHSAMPPSRRPRPSASPWASSPRCARASPSSKARFQLSAATSIDC